MIARRRHQHLGVIKHQWSSVWLSVFRFIARQTAGRNCLPLPQKVYRKVQRARREGVLIHLARETY